MRCILIGNYGVGNLGDELLREYFLKQYPEVHWQVISARPKAHELSRLPAGIRSFLRFQWLRTLQELRQSDALVFGGGSLFTDSESPHACLLWWMHARAARCFGVPVFLAFQGIGPFRTKGGEWMAKDVVRAASFVSVRDETSKTRIESWGLNSKVIQSFDPVFLLFLKEKSYLSAKNIANDSSAKNRTTLIAIPRSNVTPAFERLLREMIVSRGFDELHILSLQPDHPLEQRSLQKMKDTSTIPVVIHRIHSAEELMQGVSMGTVVLSQRYHGSLAALALGKELITLPQVTDDKHASLSALRGDPGELRRLEEKVKIGEHALREALSISSPRGRGLR